MAWRTAGPAAPRIENSDDEGPEGAFRGADGVFFGAAGVGAGWILVWSLCSAAKRRLFLRLRAAAWVTFGIVDGGERVERAEATVGLRGLVMREARELVVWWRSCVHWPEEEALGAVGAAAARCCGR